MFAGSESGNKVKEVDGSQIIQGCAGHVRTLDFILNQMEALGGFSAEGWHDLITLAVLSHHSQESMVRALPTEVFGELEPLAWLHSCPLELWLVCQEGDCEPPCARQLSLTIPDSFFHSALSPGRLACMDQLTGSFSLCFPVVSASGEANENGSGGSGVILALPSLSSRNSA